MLAVTYPWVSTTVVSTVFDAVLDEVGLVMARVYLFLSKSFSVGLPTNSDWFRQRQLAHEASHEVAALMHTSRRILPLSACRNSGPRT